MPDLNLTSPFQLFISHRSDGTMQFVGGEQALKNRRRYLTKLGIDAGAVVAGQLTSGNNLAWVGEEQGGTIIKATDGLITTSRGLYLSITVADCIPLILYQPGKILALLHVGRRGLINGIIGDAIRLMEGRGFAPSELHAHLGPHICPKDYDLTPEVANEHHQHPLGLTMENNIYHLDLSLVVVEQLHQLGLDRDKINIDETCTYESADLFSARRDKTTPTEAMMVLASL